MWWNSLLGRHSHRKITLHTDGERWYVRARDGSAEAGRELTWPRFEREYEARAWVDRLMSASPQGKWKEITKLYRRPE
jgi:hypothetical protein